MWDMRLQRARLIGVGPFADTVIPFGDEDSEPGRVTIVHGAGGVGKTTLLSAIAATRPGNASVPSGLAIGSQEKTELPYVICDWLLGIDDPERPHALRVSTPSSERRALEDDDREIIRRKEQTLFDRRAREGGFVFVAFPATRWFSRQPVALNAPMRGVARYDVRAPVSFEDATRADLTRETKQALAYADIAAALAQAGSDHGRGLDRLGAAMRSAVDQVVGSLGFGYRGLDAVSLEPLFSAGEGRPRFFDELPTRARHLVAFAALSVRALWAAYPGRDPRQAEGVVAIDEVELHQDASTEPNLASLLEQALPGVQWILTTSSAAVAASRDPRDVVALRRAPDERVELYLGRAAVTH